MIKAMLFAAGLGTRLKPITNNKPKALVELSGKAMLEHNILALKKAGVNSIVINIHHFGDKIIQFIEENKSFGIDIVFSDESNKLLDTGGGLKKAMPRLKNSDAIILQNADIISNIDYKEMLAFHEEKNAMATLAVRERTTSRYLLTQNKQLIGWQNTKSNQTIWVNQKESNYKPLGFSGIHIISPNIAALFPKEQTFNIVQWYLQVAKNNAIATFDHSQNYWFDIGTMEKLNEAQNYFNSEY